ncbi:MAG TPA: hypothetical protein PLH31_03480 [Caulobacter sp.]|nr:hypothetical protein [Caulobacter sp.]
MHKVGFAFLPSFVGRLRQKGAAEDDLAPGFALSLVDRPQCFEAFDPGFQHGETLAVVRDIFERNGVALVVDSRAAHVTQGRLKLLQAKFQRFFIADPATQFAIGFTGGPEVLALLLLGLAAGSIFGGPGVPLALIDRDHDRHP